MADNGKSIRESMLQELTMNMASDYQQDVSRQRLREDAAYMRGLRNTTAEEIMAKAREAQAQVNQNALFAMQMGAQTQTQAQGAFLPDPNTHGMLVPRIGTLCDMWMLAFGDRWVTRRDMDAVDSDWYFVGLDRLKANNKIESITHNGAAYFRLLG